MTDQNERDRIFEQLRVALSAFVDTGMNDYVRINPAMAVKTLELMNAGQADMKLTITKV